LFCVNRKGGGNIINNKKTLNNESDLLELFNISDVSVISKYNWHNLGVDQNLSEEFILKFLDKLDWETISKQKLSEDFIRRFKDNINWNDVIYNNTFSEEFILEFSKELNLFIISSQHQMTENIARTFPTDMNWLSIVESNVFSIEFILEMQKYIHWEAVSSRAVLSLDFLKTFEHKINFSVYLFYNKPDYKQILTFMNKINKSELNKINVSNLNITEKKTIEKIIKIKKMFVK
jgi:hypothetical protein